MPVSVKEISWLAGLLEGEGSFKDHNGSPGITLWSTDEDVVAKAAALFEVNQSTPYTPKGSKNAKMVYGCSVHGSRAIGWMQTIFVLMGRRRQEKIKEIILRWSAKTTRVRKPHGNGWSDCHPGRKNHGLGLCRPCYQRHYRKKHQEERKAYFRDYMRKWRLAKEG